MGNVPLGVISGTAMLPMVSGMGQRLLRLILQMDVVFFKNDVVVRSEALLDARDGLIRVAGAEIAATEIDGKAAVVERTGLVDAVHAGRHDAIHAHLGADALRSDDREQNLRPQAGNADSRFDQQHQATSSSSISTSARPGDADWFHSQLNRTV